MNPPDSEQVTSLVENPEPATMTVPPTGAEVGLSVIVRATEEAIIVKVAEAESPVEPVTVIVYDSAATLATVNEPLNVPPDIEQVSDPITPLLVIEQVVSPVENPTPETRTVDPTVADVGLSVTDGGTEGAVTVNVVEAESPVEPVAVTV